MDAIRHRRLPSNTARPVSSPFIGAGVMLAPLVAAILLLAAQRPTDEHAPASFAEPSTAVRAANATRARPAQRFPDADVVLTGVTVNGTQRMALLSVAGRPQQTYNTGQEVTAGIALHAIHADRVILTANSIFKTLRLQSNRATVVTFDPTSDLGPASADATVLFDPDALASDTDQLLRDIRVSPHGDSGFLVQEVAAASIYEKLGVQPGDVVYTLDALTIIKLEELSKLGGITNPAGVSLEVVRDGRRVWLSYRFDSPTS